MSVLFYRNLNRYGRAGGQWRHIRACVAMTGTQIAFIDGTHSISTLYKTFVNWSFTVHVFVFETLVETYTCILHMLKLYNLCCELHVNQN